MNKYIEAKVLKESIAGEIFEEFDQEYLERCPDCGSSLFRIYKEPVKEGTYEQMICAVCNHRFGGWLNDWRSVLKENDGKENDVKENDVKENDVKENDVKEKVDGRICRRCGGDLVRD